MQLGNRTCLTSVVRTGAFLLACATGVLPPQPAVGHLIESERTSTYLTILTGSDRSNGGANGSFPQIDSQLSGTSTDGSGSFTLIRSPVLSGGSTIQSGP